ncbi:hypothetical protein DRN50_08905, partial [Thermococci archaeon]
GLDDIKDALSIIRGSYIFLLFFLWIRMVLMDNYVWYIMLKKHKINIDFFYLLKIFLIGHFYGLTTPGELGWFITPFYLKEKTGEPIEKCTTNVVINGALHSILLFIFALAGAVLLLGYLSLLIPTLVVLFVFLIVLCIVFMKEKTGKNVIRFFLKIFIRVN